MDMTLYRYTPSATMSSASAEETYTATVAAGRAHAAQQQGRAECVAVQGARVHRDRPSLSVDAAAIASRQRLARTRRARAPPAERRPRRARGGRAAASAAGDARQRPGDGYYRVAGPSLRRGPTYANPPSGQRNLVHLAAATRGGEAVPRPRARARCLGAPGRSAAAAWRRTRGRCPLKPRSAVTCAVDGESSVCIFVGAAEQRVCTGTCAP